VGAYPITPSGLSSANYAITFANGTLTINKATLTITANNFTKAYDGTAYSGGNGVTYSGFVTGETAATAGMFTGTLAYSGTSQGATAVGSSYTIIPSGLSSANYTIIYVNGTLTISATPPPVKQSQTITVPATINKTYGDAAFAAGATASSGLAVSYASGNTNIATVDAAGSITIKGAGTATITVSQAGNANYSPAPSKTFTVTVAKKALTVTANNFAKTYDGTAYSGGNGVTYSAFAYSETATTAGITGTLAYGGTSQTAVNVGTYTIIPSGLSAANYTITYANGTLTIVPATPTITASGSTSICTGSSVTLTSNAANGNQWYLNGNAISGATNTTYVANASGNYTVIVTTNGVSSAASAATVIKVNALPAKPNISWNGVQFSTSAAGVNYQWLLGNNAVTGATASIYKPAAIGSYKVQITDNNGCKNTSDSFVIVVTAVDVPGAISVDHIAKLMPNPATTEVTIVFNRLPETNLMIQLVSSTGQIVKQVETREQTTHIPLGTVMSGNYFVRIIGKDYDQIQHLIITH
jgi:hypothetical protein